MDDPKIAAAIVSGVVGAVVGAIAGLMSARWQFRAKVMEVAQLQHKEVLTRRMDAYQKLWMILLTYGRNRIILGQPRDAKWARQFLEELCNCNAQCGVFFSQLVYPIFHEHRNKLAAIEGKLSAGQAVSPADFDALEVIATGTPGQAGLGAQLKTDLGSYQETILRQQDKPWWKLWG